MKVLVTTANGNTGFPAAKALLALGNDVRAMVRNKQSQSANALAALGAEVITGDLDSYQDTENALRGVDRAYFCAPFSENPLFKTVNFVAASEKAKLRHVVYMTQWNLTSTHPSIHTKEQWLGKRIAELHQDVEYSFINTGLFSFTYFFTLEMAAQFGLFPTTFKHIDQTPVGLNAPPSEADQGEVIAQILTQPEGHHQKTYKITGPKLISVQDAIATLEKVLGRSVKPFPTTEKIMLKAFKSMGFYDYQIANISYYIKEWEAGTYGLDGGVTNVVKALTGNEPESFEAIVRRQVDHHKNITEQSLKNKLIAIKNFAKILLTPAPSIHAYEKRQRFPLHNSKQIFCYENQHWKSEHALDNFYVTNKGS